MQYTHNKEIIEQLQLVLESISIIKERNEDIVSIEDYASSPLGMTILE